MLSRVPCRVAFASLEQNQFVSQAVSEDHYPLGVDVQASKLRLEP